MSFADITDIRDGLYPSLRQTLSILRDTLSQTRFMNSSKALYAVADKLCADMDEIYDAVIDTARLGNGLPLIIGQGNFGFCPAHHEFTELKLSNYFEAVTSSRYVNDFNRPFPMAVPYALATGTIGYSSSKTKIPTHNLGEVIDAVIALIKEPDMETSDLLRIIKGPDIAVGGIIENPKELPKIYESGSGIIKVIVGLQNPWKRYQHFYYYEDAKEYADWYDIKARKLRSREAVRIEIPYHAYVTDGTEARLMSLKEMLRGFVVFYKSCRKNITDEEMCEALLRFKALSLERQTMITP